MIDYLKGPTHNINKCYTADSTRIHFQTPCAWAFDIKEMNFFEGTDFISYRHPSF